MITLPISRSQVSIVFVMYGGSIACGHRVQATADIDVVNSANPRGGSSVDDDRPAPANLNRLSASCSSGARSLVDAGVVAGCGSLPGSVDRHVTKLRSEKTKCV